MPTHTLKHTNRHFQSLLTTGAMQSTYLAFPSFFRRLGPAVVCLRRLPMLAVSGQPLMTGHGWLEQVQRSRKWAYENRCFGEFTAP